MDGYRVSGAGPAFHRFGNRVRYSRSDLEGGEPPGHHDGGGRQARTRLRASIPAFAPFLGGTAITHIRDLRHSFASRALALGESLPMIGRLLGHSEVQTTERYAHLASDWLKESAVRISESIAADILTGYPGLETETLGEARGATTEMAMRPSRPCLRSGFARARGGRVERQRYESSPVGRHGAFCGPFCNTYASRALALTETLPVIGRLLGRAEIETTACQISLALDTLHETAERTAAGVAVDIMQLV